VASEFITPKQMTEQAAKVSGKKVVFQQLATGALGHEMQLNFDFFVEHQESSEVRNVAWSHFIHPKAKKWADVCGAFLQ